MLRSPLALGHSRLIGSVQPYPLDVPLSTRKGYPFTRRDGMGACPSRANGDRGAVAWRDSACAESLMSGEVLPTVKERVVPGDP